MLCLASNVHLLFRAQPANLLPLTALSEELKFEVQLLLCRQSVCTAVGSRQTLHFATLKTVRFLHARENYFTTRHHNTWIRYFLTHFRRHLDSLFEYCTRNMFHMHLTAVCMVYYIEIDIGHVQVYGFHAATWSAISN